MEQNLDEQQGLVFNNLVTSLAEKEIYRILREEQSISMIACKVAHYDIDIDSATLYMSPDYTTPGTFYYRNRTGSSLVDGQKVYLVHRYGQVDQGWIAHKWSHKSGGSAGAITLTGDVTGYGVGEVPTTLANTGVVAGTYENSATTITPLTIDSKGRITSTGVAVTIAPAFSSISGKPTTLAGYGITDAAPLSHVGATGNAHGVVTTLVNGFMSSTDKTKLDGIVDYTLPVATTSVLGGVKSGTDISVDASGNVSVVDNSHNHVVANITDYVDQTNLLVRNISAGVVTKPTYTDNLNGSFTISSFTARLYSTSDFNGDIILHTIAGGTFTPTNDISIYLVVDYNSGTPIAKLIADVLLINESNVIPVYSIYRLNTSLKVLDWDSLGLGLANKLNQRLVKTERFSRESGLILSESTGRIITITSGILWYGAVTHVMDAYNSSTVPIKFYYHSAGNWLSTTSTTYSNTQYDNGTNLATTGLNDYCVNWIYRSAETTAYAYMVLGNISYNKLSEASSAQPRSDLPNEIKTQGLLVGKIIIMRDGTTADSILSSFDVLFSSTGAQNHNDLGNIQGGLPGDYYHLSLSERSSLYNLVEIPTIVKEPTGFIDTTAVLSFVAGTRTFTITGSHMFYNDSIKITKGTTSLVISTTVGTHYIYYNSSNVLVESLTFPTTSVPLVAYVYWNGTAGLLSNERHGAVMDWVTHQYLHSTIGTRYETGLTGTFTNTTMSIGLGTIWDEDIKYDLTAQTTCDVLFKNGSVNWTWNTNQTKYYHDNGTLVYYNNVNALTTVSQTDYVAYWIFATNSVTKPIISLMGQRVDNTLSNAKNNNKYESLVLGELPFKEMKILYRVIVRGDKVYQDIEDLRGISNLPAGTYVATDHGSLSGILGGGQYHLSDVQYSQLSTIDLSSANNYDVLKYDSTLLKWVPKPDTYNHTQSVASSSWVIIHNLGKYPSIHVFDGFGEEVIGDIRFDSLIQVTLTFSSPFSGNAHLN